MTIFQCRILQMRPQLCRLRFLIQNHKVLNVRRPREEIVALMMYDFIFFLKQADVSRLRDWIAAQINNPRRLCFQQSISNIRVKSSARRINDDNLLASYIFQRFSLGAKIALAFGRFSLAIFLCISATACSLISTSVTSSPPIVKPIVPTPE